jgi:hypothetical protein
MIITENIIAFGPSGQSIDFIVGAEYRGWVHRVETDTETGVITMTPVEKFPLIHIPDWTTGNEGRSNSSEAYEWLVAQVTRLILNDAHQLINGRANHTAGLIMAQLAHVHGLVPSKVLPPEPEASDWTTA